MNTLYKELSPQGFTLVLVDMGEDRDIVAKAVKERRYIAPVLLDADGSVSEAYGVRATPTVFLIGRDGTVLGRAIGPRPWAQAEGRALLQALLKAGSGRGRRSSAGTSGRTSTPGTNAVHSPPRIRSG